VRVAWIRTIERTVRTGRVAGENVSHSQLVERSGVARHRLHRAG
jgi:hypothetical protein